MMPSISDEELEKNNLRNKYIKTVKHPDYTIKKEITLQNWQNSLTLRSGIF